MLGREQLLLMNLSGESSMLKLMSFLLLLFVGFAAMATPKLLYALRDDSTQIGEDRKSANSAGHRSHSYSMPLPTATLPLALGFLGALALRSRRPKP